MESVLEDELKRRSSRLVREIRDRVTLHWNYRAFKDMPDELLDYGSHIEEIYLKENGLRDIPNELPLRCPNLTNLYLYSNDLTRLHPSIGNMKNLTTLDLSRNRLKELPPELGHATSLRTLDLSSNQLVALPSTIGHLHKLEYIYFVGNHIQDIPPTIRHCRSLIALYAGLNDIKKIPPELAECSNLRDIYLNDNLIQFIPDVLAMKLRRLETLNLNNNHLEYLPPRLFEAQAPKIYFHDNPKLHHINYILACQINSAYPISKLSFLDRSTFRFANRGCFIPKQEEDFILKLRGSKRLTLQDGCSYVFQFPPSVNILDSKRPVPSLLELCLRSTYVVLHPSEKRFLRTHRRRDCPTYSVISSTTSSSSETEEVLLPEVLKGKLRAWSTLCAQCCLPLFFEMSLSLLRVSFKKEAERPPQEGFVSLHFCSQVCRIAFKKASDHEQIIDF